MVWMPHWPYVSERASIKLGLDRIQKFLELLGNPQDKMPPVIHVGGTNGKGSTVAFMRSILEEAGLKVHVYTSPHLKRFNERIVISGSEIEDNYLYQLLEECRVIANENNLDVSFFEGITAAAFLGFSREPADICLIEVGLGGRLDATNVFKKPLVTVITPISYDHMSVLGEKISQIAFEKAFIMKKGVPAVISAQPDEANKVIEDYAEFNEVPLFRFEYDFGIEPEIDGSFIYQSDEYSMRLPEPSLKGLHQYVNAATAVAAIKLLKGVNITDEHIKNGISNAKWQGRIQPITKGMLFKMLPKNSEVFLDGAHNQAGAQALSTWLTLQDKNIKTYLIVGFTNNRVPADFLKYFKGNKCNIICSNVHSEPLSYKSAELRDLVEKAGYENVIAASDIEEAIEKIKAENSEKVRVIVCGSLFLVADFLIAN